jgi:CheY-like chemotaxis protein
MSGSGLLDNHRTSLEKRLAGVQILIVISSARAGGLMKRLFEHLGFKGLHIAHDASEAVQILKNLHVHLIVTDADLQFAPEGAATANPDSPSEPSGIHFVERLRHAPTSPAPFIPVLMLMDQAHKKSIFAARDAGVNEVVLKPLEASNFCERIIQMIDNPRPHITASTYRGPCRRRNSGPPIGTQERRVREVRLVRCREMKGQRT